MRHKKAKRQKKKHTATKNRSSRKFATSKLHKQIILLFFSMGFLAMYFSLPVYNGWLKNRIIKFYKAFPTEFWTEKSIDDIIKDRHQHNLKFVNLMKENLPDSAVVLFPPQKYVKENFSPGVYLWAHSVWNYYFSGRGNYINYRENKRPELSRATHAVTIAESRPLPARLISSRYLPNSKLWFGPITNENGKMVEIRLTQLDSPQALESVLLEYQKPSMLE